MMKKPWLLYVLLGAVMLVILAVYFSFRFDLLVPLATSNNRNLGLPEKSISSYDGKFDLRQYPKIAKDGVNSLYFYITKAGDKTPLFTNDCEFRLLDFQYLGWGVGTYDVWVISGDSGIYCYVYDGQDKWAERILGPKVKSTDDVWRLDMIGEDGSSVVYSGEQIKRSAVPKEVIDYILEWGN